MDSSFAIKSQQQRTIWENDDDKLWGVFVSCIHWMFDVVAHLNPHPKKDLLLDVRNVILRGSVLMSRHELGSDNERSCNTHIVAHGHYPCGSCPLACANPSRVINGKNV